MQRSFNAVYICSLFAVLALAASAAVAADPTDTVDVHLTDAKAIDASARKQAAAALLASCDSLAAAAKSQGNPGLADQIKAQAQAFTIHGTLPDLPPLAAAVDQYRDAIVLADEHLDRAYSRAVRRYAAEGKSDMALALEHEQRSLAAGHSAAVSNEPASDKASAPADPMAALAAGKAQYRTDVNAATKALAGKIDLRLNSSLDAGDLKSSLVIRAIKDALNSHGQIPDNATDPAILAAVAGYRHEIQSANIRVARVFTDVVRALTRARKLDQAEAIQREFTSSELSDIDLNSAPANADAAPADSTYLLGRQLPELLTTSDHCDLHPRGGIFLARQAFVRTKNGDFLNRDFTCDIWFTVETVGTDIFIGVGDGRGHPEWDLPHNALALRITSPDAINNGAIGFLRADGQIDTVGQLPGAGEYVARLEKAGKVLALSIGDEDADGTFNAKVSTTISDPTVLAPFLTTHNAHLFFGGGRFWKLRFINGRPPAYVPDAVSKALMGG